MLFVARQAQLLLLSVFVVVVVVVLLAVLHYKRVGSGNASLSASHWETQLRPIGQVYIYLKVVQFEALVNTGKKRKKEDLGNCFCYFYLLSALNKFARQPELCVFFFAVLSLCFVVTPSNQKCCLWCGVKQGLTTPKHLNQLILSSNWVEHWFSLCNFPSNVAFNWLTAGILCKTFFFLAFFDILLVFSIFILILRFVL